MSNRGAMTQARTLLVVDDEAVQRLIVSKSAERVGYSARGVATLEAAAAYLADASPDVVVLDLSLHDRDGIELLRDIARLGRDPVIIFVSGFDARVREAAARLAVALGLRVAGTLGKPLVIEQFLEMLHDVPQAVAKAHREPAAMITPSMLEAAIEAGEIACMYQPKVRLEDGAIIGFEALARWHSPQMGMIGPDAFISMAEHHGLIDRITLHVLDSALGRLQQWQQLDPELTMAVNLSPCSLGDLGLPDRIAGVLATHRIPAHSLTLEVTEGALMADYIAAADILTRLRIRGIGIAIDDFGTGHSSLLSLLRLPFSELKIDQAFVRGLMADPETPKIVRAVLTMARSMELHTVAEGIETQAVAARLAGLGCETGQGYLFAPPLSAAAVLDRLVGAAAST